MGALTPSVSDPPSKAGPGVRVQHLYPTGLAASLAETTGSRKARQEVDTA